MTARQSGRAGAARRQARSPEAHSGDAAAGYSARAASLRQGLEHMDDRGAAYDLFDRFASALTGVIHRRRKRLLKLSRLADPSNLDTEPDSREIAELYGAWSNPSEPPVWTVDWEPADDRAPDPAPEADETRPARADPDPKSLRADPLGPQETRVRAASDGRFRGETRFGDMQALPSARAVRSARRRSRASGRIRAFWAVVGATAGAAVILALWPSPASFDASAPSVGVGPLGGGDPSALAMGGAAAADAPPTEDAFGAEGPNAEKGLLRKSASSRIETRTPPSTASRTAGPELATAPGLPGYSRTQLSGDALVRLLEARPVKCVLAHPKAADCIETTAYDLANQRYETVAAIAGGASLSVSGAFTLRADKLCHQTAGVRARVAQPAATLAQDAAAIERSAAADYAAIPGGEVCFIFSRIGVVEHAPVLVADALIDDARAPAWTDPRPFTMRPRPARSIE